MGRPSLYGTSNEFLEVFNLNEITELPSESELNELATASDVASINEIKSIVQTGEKAKFDFDELEELDQLSNSIKEIASETIFTKSLVDMDKKRSTEEGIEKKSAFDLLEEYVSKAQIVEQNKASTVSELITSIIEPKAVDPTSSEELFNVPRQEEDEFDFSELPKSELVLEDDFDDSDIISLESSLEDTNLQAEEAMNELSSIDEENLEDAPELKEPISFDEAEGGQEINFEAKELSDALDAAFDDLMGPSEDSDSEEETIEKIDLSGINAQDLDLDIDFLTDKE